MDKEPKPKDEDSKLAEKVQSESERVEKSRRWLESLGDCV